MDTIEKKNLAWIHTRSRPVVNLLQRQNDFFEHYTEQDSYYRMQKGLEND
jgi:hypothetical protein